MKKDYDIVLINSPCPQILEDRLDPPLGLLYLGTYLKNEGYSVCISDLASLPENKWLSNIPSSRKYGFTTYTSSFFNAKKINKLRKKINSDAVTIAGGPHASALPKDTLRHFDYVVIGEGEKVLADFLRGNKKSTKFERILQGKFIKNLDIIPMVEYHLIDLGTYSRKVDGKKAISLITSRGCPHNCFFCAGNIQGLRTMIRYRSIKNVIREILFLRSKYGYEAFKFHDDSFGVNHKRLRHLCEQFAKLDISFVCNMNVNDCNLENTSLLKRAGCTMISLGVESCNDNQLARMNKKQTKRQITTAINNIKRFGIKVKANLIVGFPGETWATVKETLNTVNQLRPDYVFVSAYIPQPGTPPFLYPEKFGIKKISKKYSNYYHLDKNGGTSYIFSTDVMDSKMVEKMRKFMIKNLHNEINVGLNKKRLEPK